MFSVHLVLINLVYACVVLTSALPPTPSLSSLGNSSPRNSSLGNSNLCPHGWVDGISVSMGCLGLYTDMATTWSEANQFCQKDQDAKLVKILTPEQLEFLVMQIVMEDVQSGSRHTFWTAGTDLGREGEWYWASSLSPVGEFMWSHKGEPNGETYRNCLALYDGWNYEAVADLCDSTTYPHYPICQK